MSVETTGILCVNCDKEHQTLKSAMSCDCMADKSTKKEKNNDAEK